MAEPVIFPADDLPLTEECKHYEEYSELPPHLKKYWHQRYNLFSSYDYDVYLTDDAWFGVTPEPIAMQIANDLAAKSSTTPSVKDTSPRVLIDMFAGAGGNTIAFARHGHWTHIIGIERDAATLACAQHNAQVYGVSEYITWIHADCFDVIHRLKYAPWTLSPQLLLLLFGGGQSGTPVNLSAEAWNSALQYQQNPNAGNALWLSTLAGQFELFASPPWGGPEYATAETMDLNTMEPYGAHVLHEAFSPFAHAMFLPRNGDLRQLADLVPEHPKEKLDVVQYLINGASKGLVAYYPANVTQDGDSKEDE